MALTFLQAATEVCRTIGSQNDADQITAAKTALQFAIREMNQKHNWSFKYGENTAVPVTSGVSDVAIAGAKKVYSVRVEGSNPRTLVYIRQRDWDRAVRFAASNADFMFYTTMEDGSGTITVRLFIAPAATGTITVRYYQDVPLPANDGDLIGVPERYQGLVLALGNAYYLANRDAENPRTAYWRSQADSLLQAAMEDDADQPDEDLVIQDWQDFEGGRLGRRDLMWSYDASDW